MFLIFHVSAGLEKVRKSYFGFIFSDLRSVVGNTSESIGVGIVHGHIRRLLREETVAESKRRKGKGKGKGKDKDNPPQADEGPG